MQKKVKKLYFTPSVFRFHACVIVHEPVAADSTSPGTGRDIALGGA